MTMRDALVEAMNLPDDAVERMHAGGFSVADEDTMSRAIHDVYCGIAADHEHPNEKDREQARAMLAAIRKHGLGQTPA